MTPTKPKPDNLEKARAAWGEQPPEWIIALAEACNAENQTLVGKRIGYAGSTVSQLLSNSYPGDVGRIEQLVRGALMSETVRCPVLQEIGRDVCLGWQRRP
ncbi:transcriptional regulator, partial [Agrobacterium genomosp. 2]